MVDRGVVSDAIDPRRELILGAVLGQGVIDLDEDFLRNVESRIVIAEHPKYIAGDRPLVTSDEFFETVLAAGDRLCNQIEVGKGGFILKCYGCHLIKGSYAIVMLYVPPAQ